MQVIDTFRSVVRLKMPTLVPVERRLEQCVSVDDMRRIARRRLPRGVFDYIDGGAEDERTMNRNVDAFARFQFEPRVLRDVSDLDTSTSLFGRSLSMPIVIAPTGLHPDRRFAGRARRRSRCPPCRHPVLAVDDGDAVDRRGGVGVRRRQVVPDLHLARPSARRGARRASEGGRVHDRVAHRRHCRARASRA
jgi:hypothetical protein